MKTKAPLINISYASILLLAFFLLFYKIDEAPIRIWDEAIYANNALELALARGNPLVLTNDGVNTLYNTKPPLVIWLQSICIKIFGANEFAIRLPSALAVLATIISLFIFASKVLKIPLIGLTAGLTLLVSEGYFRTHVAKTGDLDATLVFFISAYTLLYFSFLLQADFIAFKKKIYGIGILITLAFFSKSFAGLIPILGLFIIILIHPLRKKILTTKHLYGAILGTISFIIGYYLLREFLGAGYIQKVYQSEIKRLFENIMPYHNHPFEFYYKNWFDRNYFYPFIYFVLASPLLLFLKIEEPCKKLVLYSLIWSLSYFLIISIPIVKLDWYDAPLYPIFSLLVGIWIYQITTFLKKKISNTTQVILSVLVIVLLYATALQKSITAASKPPTLLTQEFAGNFIRTCRATHPQIKDYSILYQVKWIEHQDQAKFYQKSFNEVHNYQIKIKQHLAEIQEDSIILTCQQVKIDSIQQRFQYQVLAKDENCQLLKIRVQ